MVKLLLFVLVLSRDTIITNLVPKSPTAPPLTLRIVNSSTTPLKNITLDWSLETNGAITRKGKASFPLLAPGKPILLRLPLRLPDDSTGETFLQLQYRSAIPSTTARATPAPLAATLPAPLADQQILLKPWLPRLTILPAGELSFYDENDIFTIRSPAIRISFNRQTGWLVHYEIKGIDLLDDTLGLRSNFWWPSYNVSAPAVSAFINSAPADSAPVDSSWLAATRGPRLQLFSNTTSPELIIVRTEYTLPATASLLHLSYTINADGEMLITQQVEPDTTQPSSRSWPPPCFGMQWILPPGYDSISAYGPLPPKYGAHAPNPGADLASTHPHLFQDYPTKPIPSDPNTRSAATRTDLRWWTITDKNGNGLQFIADTPLLNESALYPTLWPRIQVSIDRATPNKPNTPSGQPCLSPIGNYLYTYKVKPLVTSAPR